jgi:hypothetical protein
MGRGYRASAIQAQRKLLQPPSPDADIAGEQCRDFAQIEAGMVRRHRYFDRHQEKCWEIMLV